MIVFEEDIRKKIIADFHSNSEEAFALLQEALMDVESLRPSRIIRCIIYLAEGTITGLHDSMAMAKMDPRDVIMCAEYEYDPIGNSESRVRDFSMPFEEE